jgi:ribose/xylose/arabinose/galactoside ABC-type transport system permease subunit
MAHDSEQSASVEADLRAAPLEGRTKIRNERTRAKMLSGISGRMVGLLVALGSLFVFFSVFAQYFLTTQNLLNTGRAISLLGIVAAITTVVLISGSLDLSIGATMALSGMAAATVMSSGAPGWVGVLVGLGAGLVIGLANGAMIVLAGVNPLIATIGSALVIRGLAFVVNDGRSIVVEDQGFLNLAQGTLFGVPKPVFFFALAFLVVWFALTFTRWGLRIFALGSNESAAARSGVRVSRARIAVYVWSALVAAGAGILLTSGTGSVFPYAAVGVELSVIAAVILGGTALLGGRGSVLGTLIGVLILGVLTNGLNLMGVKAWWQEIAQGLVLILAITWDALREKRRAR